MPDNKEPVLSKGQTIVVKLVVGLGLVGVLLYFSPVTLADMSGVFLVPILIALGLIFGTTLFGQGLIGAIQHKEWWLKVQEAAQKGRDQASERFEELKKEDAAASSPPAA